MPEVGGIRLYGLAKYLPEHGWKPIILTPTLPGEPDPRFRVIQTPYEDVIALWKKRMRLNPKESLNEQFCLSKKKNQPSIIDRLVYLPSEIITYPDPQKGWYKHAIKAGDQLLQEVKIDAILSSSKPEICHLIARNLAEKYQIPWVADLRDLWTQNPYLNHCALRRFAEKRLELRTLGKASALVTVSKPLADDLSRLHTHNPVYVITNGFDPEVARFDPPELTDKFTITYTGSLYDGKRDPSTLFKALKNLIKDGTIDPDRVEVRFFGSQDPWLFDEIRDANLDGIVKVFGFIPREQALQRQRESHLLLLLLWNNPKEKGVYTGKVFEYLAARRPIIAVGGPEESVVKDLLNETQAGQYTSSLEDLEVALSRYYSEYVRTGAVPRTEESAIFKYSQLEMAKKFAAVLDKVVAEAPQHHTSVTAHRDSAQEFTQ
ncbi:glycosyltransferase [Methanoculleus sp.]|uniref:glycosyltransferase n=1 Tax=Methanoculleus sp. TaxID=90427 RepID=UPI00261E061E|nr:glycosyltransferase [Methanoculleus sp.]MDI6867846.1 glycosyltransferase [Methanoculleus sp.]